MKTPHDSLTRQANRITKRAIRPYINTASQKSIKAIQLEVLSRLIERNERKYPVIKTKG